MMVPLAGTTVLILWSAMRFNIGMYTWMNQNDYNSIDKKCRFQMANAIVSNSFKLQIYSAQHNEAKTKWP